MQVTKSKGTRARLVHGKTVTLSLVPKRAPESEVMQAKYTVALHGQDWGYIHEVVTESKHDRAHEAWDKVVPQLRAQIFKT